MGSVKARENRDGVAAGAGEKEGIPVPVDMVRSLSVYVSGSIAVMEYM